MACQRCCSNIHRPPRRSTVKRTRVVDPNTYQKGDPSDTKSCVNLSDSKPRLGRYLGYEDAGELRKFLLSFWVLEPYLVFAKHCSAAKSSPRVAPELLRDLQDQASEFPSGLPEMVAKYPSTASAAGDRAKNANYLLAAIP